MWDLDVQNATLIEQLRYQAYIEANMMLEEYSKACIIRPMGFGKTGILTRFIQDYKDSGVVYLYPNEAIRNAVLDFYYGKGNVPDNREIDGVYFLSYAKMSRMRDDDYAIFEDKSLLISDEAHLLGGGKVCSNTKKVFELYPNLLHLGATATPERMDLFDIIQEFYEGKVISPYSLHDAMRDGVLQRPYYCYCSYGVKGDLKEISANTKKNFKGLSKNTYREAEAVLNSRLIEISNLLNMDTVIRDTLTSYLSDTFYIKGIVFFSSFESLHDKEEDVISWFKKAFPMHKVNSLIVTSETAEYAKNVLKLDTLKYKKGVIDLIFTVDMLNFGYHVSDLSFVGMYRGTNSGIIYPQQLGRGLSSGDSEPSVIFDWVDNLHRESIYVVLGKKKKSTIEGKIRYTELTRKLIELGSDLKDISMLPIEEQKEYRSLLRRFSQDYGSWCFTNNDLEPEDLIVTPHQAIYEELIRKTVAEPISMRCRQAAQMWEERGGVFADTAEETCNSAFPPKSPPLLPFAKIKRVSVDAVLQEIFDTGEDYSKIAEKYISLLKENPDVVV